MRDHRRQGKGPTGKFWRLKALTQLIDFRIHHAADAAIIKAENALLAGVTISREHPVLRGSPAWLNPVLVCKL